VTNTGNVTLTSITLTDPLVGLSPIDCGGVTSLAAGASVDCTATYTTTQADVDAGEIVNTATLTGTPPSGLPLTAKSSVTVSAVDAPAVSVVKSSDTPSFAAPGVVITYTYTVTNTGNVTLSPVTVTDPMPGLSPLECSIDELAPGDSTSCTATYTT